MGFANAAPRHRTKKQQSGITPNNCKRSAQPDASESKLTLAFKTAPQSPRTLTTADTASALLAFIPSLDPVTLPQAVHALCTFEFAITSNPLRF